MSTQGRGGGLRGGRAVRLGRGRTALAWARLPRVLGGGHALALRTGGTRGRSGTAALAGAVGAAAGAALMYVLDPARGKRRRALVKDKAVHYSRKAGAAGGVVGRDLRNRGAGMVAVTRRGLRPGKPSSQHVEQSVRRALRHGSRHPGAVGVEVRDGIVTLQGPVLREEVDRLRRRVARVRGVEQVEDRLEIHEEPGATPVAPGSSPPRRRHPLRRQRWAPGVRAVAGAAGLGLLAYGAWRRGRAGMATAVAGTALTVRAATNRPARRLTGTGARRRARPGRDRARASPPMPTGSGMPAE